MGRGLRAAPPSPPSRPLPGSHTSPSTLCTSQAAPSPERCRLPAQELLRRRGGSESLKRGFVSLCVWSGGDGQEPWGVLPGRRRRPKCLLVPCGASWSGRSLCSAVLVLVGSCQTLPVLGGGVGDARRDIPVPGLRERNFYMYFIYLQRGVA